MTDIEIHRDADGLIAWLLNTRPDWHEWDIIAAIAGADTLALGWAQISMGLHRLAFEKHGQPRDLSPAYPRQEPKPGTGTPPDTARTELAAARERMAAATGRHRQAREDAR